MSDYTPTTEEIRAAALTDYREEEIAPQQFDRWLAEVKAEQDKATTERIIAQLEVQKRFVEPELFDGVVEAIALIKGENK